MQQHSVLPKRDDEPLRQLCCFHVRQRHTADMRLVCSELQVLYWSVGGELFVVRHHTVVPQVRHEGVHSLRRVILRQRRKPAVHAVSLDVQKLHWHLRYIVRFVRPGFIILPALDRQVHRVHVHHEVRQRHNVIVRALSRRLPHMSGAH